MIKITNETNLMELERLNITDVFRKYIVNYYNEMLLRFECENLEGLGSIFVLDSEKDVEDSKLEDFLTKYPPHRVVGLTLFDEKTPLEITHILVVSGGYAVNIFVEEKYVSQIILNIQKEVS